MVQGRELLDQWVGQSVMVELLGGPPLDPEQIESLFAVPGSGFSAQPKARAAVYRLLGYDEFGVGLQTLEEGAPPIFVSWAAVLFMYEGEPEELARIRREPDEEAW